MSTKIRLARAGSKKNPSYRVVVADSRAPRDGKFIEKIGTYNPLFSKDSTDRIILKKDRVDYWLSKGAVPTERVVLFFKAAGIAQDNKYVQLALKKRDNTIKIKRVELEAKKKAEAEQAAAEAKAKKDAEEAAAAEKAKSE